MITTSEERLGKNTRLSSRIVRQGEVMNTICKVWMQNHEVGVVNTVNSIGLLFSRVSSM